MSVPRCADVVLYLCCNCIPQGARLPRQWKQNGLHIKVQEVPCSGKIDVQYLFHAFEGGARGVCVVACPQGDCKLAQGNYRAEIRVRMVKTLLTEIGIEPERVELAHCSAAVAAEDLKRIAEQAAERFAKLGEAPLCSSKVCEKSSE